MFGWFWGCLGVWWGVCGAVGCRLWVLVVLVAGSSKQRPTVAISLSAPAFSVSGGDGPVSWKRTPVRLHLGGPRITWAL